MTSYLNGKKFTVGMTGEKYSDGWERTFGKKHTHDWIKRGTTDLWCRDCGRVEPGNWQWEERESCGYWRLGEKTISGGGEVKLSPKQAMDEKLEADRDRYRKALEEMQDRLDQALGDSDLLDAEDDGMVAQAFGIARKALEGGE